MSAANFKTTTAIGSLGAKGLQLSEREVCLKDTVRCENEVRLEQRLAGSER